MNIANESAFPIVEMKEGVAVAAQKERGLTKFEYLVAHAPEVPEWFPFPVAEYKTPQPPHWDTLGEAHKEIAKNWISDACFDLPEELKWFQEKWECRWKEVSEFESIKNEVRYFEWRAFYADKIIQQLLK